MENPDRVAHRYPAHETYRLVDYRAVALPVLILRLDVVVLQRRKVPIPTEFALRAIVTTNGSREDVVGVLGLGQGYSQMMMREMERDQLITVDESKVTLLPKGDFMLATLHQSETRDIEVTALWDMAAQKVVSHFIEELITHREADAQGLIRLAPKSTKPPAPERIDIDAVQRAWASSRSRGQEDDEIIKVVAVRGAGRFRVRPAVALAYASEDRKDVRAQVAVADTLDDDLAQSFGKFGWAEQLHLRGLQGQKTSERALRARVFGGENAGPTGAAHLQLIQRQAVLRFKRDSLQAAQEMQRTEEREEKLGKVTSELAQVGQRLTAGDASELLPFEMAAAFSGALKGAKRAIWTTTTLPTRRRLSEMILRELEEALKSGLEVRVLIADRIRSTQEEALPAHLGQLNRLVGRHGNLDVGFLMDYGRAFYEVLVDDDILFVANDPPLGERKEADRFRAFAGLRLSSPALIGEYKVRHLSSDALKIADRFVIARKHSTAGTSQK